MFNAFKNMLNMGGGNEKKPSVAGQNQKTSDDNVRYEVISFEIQESDNLPRARMFTGKPDEEEYESQVPAELIRKRTLSTKNVSEEEDKKSKKVVLEDLQKYIYYTTTNQDTLIGLSIKFNISEAKIKLINDVSDTIFPGMKLKFPKDQCKPAAPAGGEENDGIPSDYQAIHRKALSLKKEQNTQIQRALAEVQEVHRYHFYYCTPYGNIMGCLSINEGVIMFDPSLSNVTNMQKLQSKLLLSMFLSVSIAICVQEKRVIKFQACIDIKDINEALALVLPPRASEMVSEDTKEYVLQISLSHIGNKDIYKKYKDRLKQLKKEKKSISTVFFRVFEKDALGADLTNADKQKIVQNVVAIINKNVEQYNMGNLDNPTDKVDLTEAKNLGFEIVGKEDLKKLSDTSESTKSDKKEGQGNNGSTTKESESNPAGEKEPAKEEDDDDEEEQESLTILPFFDILYENIVQKKKQAQSNIENEQSELAEWLQSEFAPKMNETQTVLTQELFLQIIFYVPSMFRFTNWKIIYSNLQHGMSFQTLLRNCEEDSPVFVVIQTFQNERFGAYLSDAIHSGFHFYGTGECFLFKFLGEEQNKIKLFRATGKNEHFIFSNPDGMGIGCGEKYGLYINSDLYKGETNKCDTFDNDLLTSDQEKSAFKIKTIEIWGLDM